MHSAVLLVKIKTRSGVVRKITVDIEETALHQSEDGQDFCMSHHAVKRMSQRAINPEQIQLALEYGRLIHSRHAKFYVIGKKEVRRLAKEGLDLRLMEGLQVVVNEKTNLVMTVYKNQDFRQIRPQYRRQRHLH